MTAYSALRGREPAEDESAEALLAEEKPSTTRTRSPKRRNFRGRESLICGHRPASLLVVLIPVSLLLVSLYHFFPDLIRHRTPNTSYIIPPRPTKGLKKGDAAYNAMTGPWADVGDDYTLGLGREKTLHDPASLLSNGTHDYKRTVLVVSLDGVRADFLTRGLTPHLLDISQRDGGIKAEYLQSIFPTLTFPNHWSILTGLYAESHGIIGNDFLDPATQKDFLYVDPAKSWQPHWWKGEPSQRSGRPPSELACRVQAVLMWPGPPILQGGIQPSRWYAFENHVDWSRKTALIEGWLDLPLDSRPRFIAAYLPEVDQEAHRSGTQSTELNNRLKYADEFAKSIHDALAQRNLLDIVDVFYVSDHGMTDVGEERLIYLEDILGQDGYEAIEHKDGWPSCGLRFRSGTDVASVVTRLEAEASRSQGAFNVYTAQTMPKTWHFSSDVNDRIAPIYIVPSNGWSITDRAELKTMNGSYSLRGNHGYDNREPDMHAMFVAHGPFAKAAQSRHGSSTMPGFANIELYNLFARLLGISPVSNNGTASFWDVYF